MRLVRSVEHLSLLTGPVPTALTVVAFAALVLFLAGVPRRSWPRTTMMALGSVAAVVALGTAFGIEHRVGSTFPQTFFLWAALPLFVLTVAVWRWRVWSLRRRILAVATVVLAFGFGAESVNTHYAYLPTVGDAIGRPVEDQVSPASVPASPAHGHLVAGRRHAARPAGHGVVVEAELPGAVSRFRARDALIWLPPAYFTSPSPRLPVVLLLAGVPGDPSDLLRAARVAHIADQYAAAHQGMAPILAFPDHNGAFFNDSECVDGPRGNVETYLTVDVPQFLAQRFHAAVLDRALGIAGYSEGGTCAVTLALRHPDRFSVFLDIAGDARPNAASGPHAKTLTINRLYAGDATEWPAHDPATLLQHRFTIAPTALFATGAADLHARNVARSLFTDAQQAGLTASLNVYPGGHTFRLVHRALAELFPTVADVVLHTQAEDRPV